MKFVQASNILLLWSCIGFIDIMEMSVIQKRATPTVCETATCNESAQFLLNNMDQTVNPCEDFYQFACGGFIAKTKLPADRTEYGIAEILAQNALEQIEDILVSTGGRFTPEVKKAQQMYSNCLHQAIDIRTLQNQVKQLGGWPIAETTTINTATVSLETLLAKLSLKGTNAIFETTIDIDLTNSEQYIIQVNNGELPVDPSLLKSQGNMNSYTNFIQTSALALGAENIVDIRPQIDAIVQLDTQFASITPKVVAAINFTAIYQKMTIQQLQQVTDPQVKTFNWLTYFNELTNLNLESSQQIGVFNVQFLIEAVKLITSTNKNTVLNYAIWCFVEDVAWTVGGEVQQDDLAVQKELTGLSQNPPRNTTCTAFVNSIWGFALAKPYVAKVFPSSDVQQALQIAQTLIKVYDSLLSSNVSFLQGSAQTIAVEKVSQMQLLIGYPTWISNDTAVAEYFKNYPEMNSTSLTNSINALESKVQQNLKLLGTPVIRNQFETLPTDIVSVYDESLNSISFPAALLQQPIFTPGNGIQALNFGFLGVIASIQINNAIDYEGSQFDLNGNLNDWWSASVTANVNGRDVTCVTEQFNQYCSKTNPKICIDGAATALEHIADYDGAQISYYAYEQWVAQNGREQQLPGLTRYTSEQIFFISFAQQLCTATVPQNIVEIFQYDPQLENRFSINGALANIATFASTFNCPVGPMNRGNQSCIPF